MEDGGCEWAEYGALTKVGIQERRDQSIYVAGLAVQELEWTR